MKPTVHRRLAVALLVSSVAGFVTHFIVAALLSADGYSRYAAALAVASLPGVLHLSIHNQAQHSVLEGGRSSQRQALVLVAIAAGCVAVSANWWAPRLELPVVLTTVAVLSYLVVAAFSASVRGSAMAQSENIAANTMLATSAMRVIAATACALVSPVAGLIGLAIGELIPALVLHLRLGRFRGERADVASVDVVSDDEVSDDVARVGAARGSSLFVSVVAHVGMFLMCYTPVLVVRGRLDADAAAGFAFASAVVGGQLSLAYAIAWPAANAGGNARRSALKAMALSCMLSVPAVGGIVVAASVLALEKLDVVSVVLMCITATLAAPVIVLMQVALRAGRGGVLAVGLTLSAGVVIAGVSVQSTPVGLAAVSVVGAVLVQLFAWRCTDAPLEPARVVHVVTQRYDRHEAVCKTVTAIAAALPGRQCVIAPGMPVQEGHIAPRIWAPLAPLAFSARRVLRSADVVVIHGGPLGSLTALLAPRGRIVVHVYASVRLKSIGTWRDSFGTQAAPLRAMVSSAIGWPLMRRLAQVGRIDHVVCASDEIRSHLSNAGSSSVLAVAPIGETSERAQYRAQPHLFFAGRAENTRGVFDVIEAVAVLRRRGVEASATLAVRSGKHINEVMRRAEAVDSVLVLAGDSDRLSHEMAVCTVGVWPFLTEATVTPATTTVEAAMAGLPVITTALGCCSVVACMTVEPGSAEAIADAVLMLHSSEAAWTSGAERSRTAAITLAVNENIEALTAAYQMTVTPREMVAIEAPSALLHKADVAAQQLFDTGRA